jgi:hypothetical protein
MASYVDYSAWRNKYYRSTWIAYVEKKVDIKSRGKTFGKVTLALKTRSEDFPTGSDGYGSAIHLSRSTSGSIRV